MTRDLSSTIQRLLQAGRANIVFGILAAFLFLIIIIFVAKFIDVQDRNSGQITLTADQNKFKLNFNLTNQDLIKFSKVLNKLNLPQSVKDGIEFELDATSSAKLAFTTPIKTNFNILPEKITFQGQIDKSFVNDQAAESLKIPASTNLAVFGNNIAEFVMARLNLPDQLSTWFLKNLNFQNGSVGLSKLSKKAFVFPVIPNSKGDKTITTVMCNKIEVPMADKASRPSSKSIISKGK